MSRSYSNLASLDPPPAYEDNNSSEFRNNILPPPSPAAHQKKFWMRLFPDQSAVVAQERATCEKTLSSYPRLKREFDTLNATLAGQYENSRLNSYMNDDKTLLLIYKFINTMQANAHTWNMSARKKCIKNFKNDITHSLGLAKRKRELQFKQYFLDVLDAIFSKPNVAASLMSGIFLGNTVTAATSLTGWLSFACALSIPTLLILFACTAMYACKQTRTGQQDLPFCELKNLLNSFDPLIDATTSFFPAKNAFLPGPNNR